MPSGEEVYHAGDSLSPTPYEDDAAGIAAWLPRAEAWVDRARAWRTAQVTDNDPWTFYVDARLDAVSRMIEARKRGTSPDPVSVIPPVVTPAIRALRGIGAGVSETGRAVPYLAFAAIVVAGIVVAFVMSR